MPPIEFNLHHSIAILTVNRPEVRNALNRPMMEAFAAEGSPAEAQTIERAEFPKLWVSEAHMRAVEEFLGK